MQVMYALVQGSVHIADHFIPSTDTYGATI